jgi:hypothetical protein
VVTADETARAGRWWRAGLVGPVVAVASILWFGGELWAAHRGIRDSGGGSFAVAAATNALPAVMHAALLAGVGAGALATIALRRWRPAATGIPQWTGVVLAGLIVGFAGLGGILAVYGDVPTVAGIATAVVLAGLLGAVVVAIRPEPTVVVAGLCGAFAGAVVSTILNSGRVVGDMMSAFGGRRGASPAAIVSANSIVSHIDAAVVGIVAGLVAYRYLRGQRTGMPAFLAAGALTGLLLLAAEAFIRTGGAGLLHTTRLISVGDDISVSELASSRVIGALMVLFIGAFVALLGYGRSLPARRPSGSPTATALPDAADAADADAADAAQRSS